MDGKVRSVGRKTELSVVSEQAKCGTTVPKASRTPELPLTRAKQFLLSASISRGWIPDLCLKDLD